MNYEVLRGYLKTGDILLFSGKGTVSNLIKFVSRSKWSHVAMVVVDTQYDFILCWESTKIGNTIDIESGRLVKGVQVSSLSDKLRNYDGEISVRRLSRPLLPEMQQKLTKFRLEVRGRKYEQCELELIKSTYEGLMGENKKDLSSLFCSELIAEAYQRMGLLTESVPSNEYDPEDFSKIRNLERNYILEEPMRIEK